MTKLPERLFVLRQERDMSQKKLVQEMGLALNTYVRYERGEREPTASTLVQMADFYGILISVNQKLPPEPRARCRALPGGAVRLLSRCVRFACLCFLSRKYEWRL